MLELGLQVAMRYSVESFLEVKEDDICLASAL